MNDDIPKTAPGKEYTPQGSQHVLKAEAEGPDATDRETPANLQAAPAVMRATVTITRKETGKVETYDLFATLIDNEPR